MDVHQASWSAAAGWSGPLPAKADLVLVFADAEGLADQRWRSEVEARLPGAKVVGCTTAGQIAGTRVYDDSVIATFVGFGTTRLEVADVELGKDGSHGAGRELARLLPSEGLVHVLVLSDGLNVNGSELVAGLASALPPGVQVTGGLAGDGPRFQHTLVLAGGRVAERRVVAVGFYGAALRVGFGSLGGWDPFGPQRVVTRSAGNVVFELDGRPALDLYKEYLGEHAQRLPASGLLFPLSVQTSPGRPELVRTILAVDEQQRSLTFAGDVPRGAVARLMKANFDRLVDGADGAARRSQEPLGGADAQLAILISCVGRRLVLDQRVEDELEAVRDVLGDATLVGFYSYGEICPTAPAADCELHNQTMTITTLREE